MKKILLIFLVLTISLGLCACDSADYKDAMAKYYDGSYTEAIALFQALGDYEDSASMVTECKYQIAFGAYQGGEYADARKLFEELGDYEDCMEKAADCTTRLLIAKKDEAAALVNSAKYTEALEILEELDKEGALTDSFNALGWCRLAAYLAENGEVTMIGTSDSEEVTYALEDGKIKATGLLSSAMAILFELKISYEKELAELIAAAGYQIGAANYMEAGGTHINIRSHKSDMDISWEEYSYEGTDAYGNSMDSIGLIAGNTFYGVLLENMAVNLEDMAIDVTIQDLGFLALAE